MNPSLTARDFRTADVPQNGFVMWFLGQNSFVLKSPGGLVVAIDPYLSDWCATRGLTKERVERSRLYPPPFEPEDLDVDFVLLTHSHCDHADPETLSRLAPHSRASLIAPFQAAAVAREAGWPAKRLHLIHASEAFQAAPDLLIWATYALPTDGSDLNHIGFLLRFGSASFYNTGDTAWCDQLPGLVAASVRAGLPEDASGPDVMAVCVNAGYGNLSHWDASRLAASISPRYTVPCHWDLFPHNSCDPEPFRTSLSKNAHNTVYARLERFLPYVFDGDGLRFYEAK